MRFLFISLYILHVAYAFKIDNSTGPITVACRYRIPLEIDSNHGRIMVQELKGCLLKGGGHKYYSTKDFLRKIVQR